MTALGRRLATRTLSAVRARWGRQDINWTPEFMGFGNQLYLWCWAHERREQRPAPKVLITAKMRPWLTSVPQFHRRFLLERSEVSFLDRREHHWSRKEIESGHAQGFSRKGRTEFIRALHDEPLLAGVEDTPLAEGDVLTVNVRRGDYYSVPAHRAWFAIDLAAHLSLAIRASIERDGPVRRIHVVSDDPKWCRQHVPELVSHAREVTYAAEGQPVQHFRDVCGARRLVLSNSTFSIWGAFVSRTLLGQDPGMIWAPAFFQSSYGPGRCVEYDEDFSFIDELPGGWQPAWVLAGEQRP